MKKKKIRPPINPFTDEEREAWLYLFHAICDIHESIKRGKVKKNKPPPKKKKKREFISFLPSVYITCTSTSYRSVKVKDQKMYVPKYLKRVHIQSCEKKWLTLNDKKSDCYLCDKWMRRIPKDWRDFYYGKREDIFRGNKNQVLKKIKKREVIGSKRRKRIK